MTFICLAFSLVIRIAILGNAQPKTKEQAEIKKANSTISYKEAFCLLYNNSNICGHGKPSITFSLMELLYKKYPATFRSRSIKAIR